MNRLASFIFALSLLLNANFAMAGGGGGGGSADFDWAASTMTGTAGAFVEAVSRGELDTAYGLAGDRLKARRTAAVFSEDMRRVGLAQAGTVNWRNGTAALPGSNGFKLMGTFTTTAGEDIPVYMHLEGDAHVSVEDRNREWSDATRWTVLDYRSGQSFATRLKGGNGTGLDWFLALAGLGLAVAFCGMVWTYVSGLRGSPRELYLMFFTKLTEYSAYGAASAILVLFLSNDVQMNGQSLGDTNAYMYYTVWSLALTVVTIMVGSVCDTIGIKKCLLIGAVMLLTSRFFTPMSQNIVVVTLLGFLPLAIGFAITGPVLKVGIKKFTTLKTATLGFGLFYTMMNVGFWIGAEIADWFRKTYGDTGHVDVLGMEFTTYQAIIAVGFLINIPDFIAILIMRDGAEMTEKGLVLRAKSEDDGEEEVAWLKTTVSERKKKMISELLKSLTAAAVVGGIAAAMIKAEVHTWAINVVPVGKYLWALVAVGTLFTVGGVLYASLSRLGALSPGGSFDVAMKAVRDATQGTIAQLKENFQEKAFWIYMGMLGVLVFVRLTFYIFHVMFPTYAIRVLGPDFPVASIFGSLNPAMIIFLVPLISILSINVRSYTMLLWGTAISAGSVFLCFLPESVALGIGDSWLGTWIFDYWLEAPVGGQDPFVISLVVFIIVFTVGEAIWSPRLMQFSAEIAPRGKEGAYIALAMLPYFLGKMGAAVMSEQLTTRFFNADMLVYPDHDMAWLAIGSMAMVSPIGMLVFRNIFNQSEKAAEIQAELVADEATEEVENTAMANASKED
jgi:hypothetical protein